MSTLLAVRTAFRRCVQQSPSQYGAVRRCSLGNPIRFERLQRDFQKKDDVRPEYELIYRNQMERYITIGSVVVKSAAVAGTVFILYQVFYAEGSIFDMFIVTTSHKMRVASGQKEVIAFFALSYFVLALLYMVVNRLALRIYNHGDKYVAVFTGKIPFTFEKVAFTTKEVVAPSNQQRPFNFLERPFRLAGRKTVLIEDYFRKPGDIVKLISRQDYE